MDEKGTNREEFSYDGYEVVRGVFFAHLFEPSVRLAKEQVSVNSACIRRLPETEYVQFLVNRNEKKMVVKPCSEETKDSFRWNAVGKDGKIRPKIISCKEFYDRIMKLMDWNPECRYRIMGKLMRTKTECIFVFDLKDAEIFQKGKRGDRGSRKAIYPQEWNTGFGVPFEEHQSEVLVNIMEDSAVFYLEKKDEEADGTNAGKEANE